MIWFLYENGPRQKRVNFAITKISGAKSLAEDETRMSGIYSFNYSLV